MAANVLVDSGFLVALLRKRDQHNEWAQARAEEYPRPWHTCESVLSEVIHLSGGRAVPVLADLLRRRALVLSFEFGREFEAVFALMKKYADIPMALADACLVRMTETVPNPILLAIDGDFRIYRRLGRQIVPCVLPDM